MVHLFGRSWAPQELARYTNSIDQVAGVRSGVIDDGKGRGLRTVDVETGSGFSYTVQVDRGLDIGRARFRGASLAWESSVGPVHPMYYEKDGLSWHRTWGGGLLNGCGLTHIGAPADDQGEQFGIHGRLSHIPASNVWSDAAWHEDNYVLWVQGKVRETTAKGENVVVERRIWSHLGESWLFVRDRVTNEGLEPAPHMILYHLNFGFPLVTEGTQLLAPSDGVTPLIRDGREPIDHTRYPAPIDGFVEQAFLHTMRADADGWATVVLANRGFDSGRGLGVYCRYRPEQLPTFMQWMFVRAGMYVTAFEPHFGTMRGRARARAEGTLPFLAPGESREYNLEVGVLADNAEIDARTGT